MIIVKGRGALLPHLTWWCVTIERLAFIHSLVWNDFLARQDAIVETLCHPDRVVGYIVLVTKVGCLSLIGGFI